jgi:hypothetical protein
MPDNHLPHWPRWPLAETAAPAKPIAPLTAALRCSAALLSDDLDEVRAAEAVAQEWCAAAEAAVIAADNAREADYAAYEAAEAEFSRADHALALLGRKLDELEQEAGWDELREQRRAYWRRVY